MRSNGETDESFIAAGDQLLDLLTEHAGLCEDSRVLEIGCGYGQFPHALRRHGFAGTYLGIDVLKPQVRWCARQLGGDGFQFRHVDIANERYNPGGKVAVSNLELGDARFDVIVAFDLFTHMWPDDLLAHFGMLSRSLAFDGRAAATFFLLDDEPHDPAENDQAARPRLSFSSTTSRTIPPRTIRRRRRCRSRGSPVAATSRRTTPSIASATSSSGWC